MIYTITPGSLRPERLAINHAYLLDENEHLSRLIELARLDETSQARVEERARALVLKIREVGFPNGGVDAFLHEYDLSTQEGVVLMCLAEALLRIPDADTADRLIRDKLSQAEWDEHIGNSPSLFVNASTWGLLLTGRIVKLAPEITLDSSSFFGRLLNRSGEPVIRMALMQAMRIMGHQFVMGSSIKEALRRSEEKASMPFRHSFDMLGETALTANDAQRYFNAYADAIAEIKKHATGELLDNPGISVKLSALHPRYEYSQRHRLYTELAPRLLQLALAAKAANIILTVDAEESSRLDISLDIFEQVLRHSDLKEWNGFGLAVQAYQKRALAVIDWLAVLAIETEHQIPIRLVKGAYWDAEIKQAQEQGLDDYPVFTRKTNTDVSYLACASRIINNNAVFYPQFATHNAHTVASIIEMAGARDYEFQRLHGMGESLYSRIMADRQDNIKCRVYAPVGDHKDLLPYLVRRLLENGANTSFVNRIVDEDTSIEEIVADPVAETAVMQDKRHPKIPVPRFVYGNERINSRGINLNDAQTLETLDKDLETALQQQWHAGPIVGGVFKEGQAQQIVDPAHNQRSIGDVCNADEETVETALAEAHAACEAWSEMSASKRADLLDQVATLLENKQSELAALCIREGGRTIADSQAEVREAIDFCRYYAHRARKDFDQPLQLSGVTGERNELRLAGRGVFVCISPWNFPVAIFTGQIAAALAAGNSVIAKPAGLTPITATHVVRLFHQAGIPGEVLHLLIGSGSEIGTQLINDERVAGVAFTGSTETAQKINQSLAQRRSIIPLIAETGGQNAMIVDSSALPEQVVKDVISSAFNSAGQRCSALRVLFLQQDVAPQIIEMLSGAMDELNVGDPGILATDIGPVISQFAKQSLQQHAQRMDHEARLIKATSLSDECSHGSFFAPRAYEIQHLGQLTEEVFGPILHIIQYQASKLDEVIEAINNTGYGLTLGIHSRLDSTAALISRKVRCGNIYINRNMIGAVVGSQPFGGEGLSGTGPKAGGPHYLYRFATERVLTTNTAAVGGNATLLSLDTDAE